MAGCTRHPRHVAGCEHCKERARKYGRERRSPDWVGLLPADEVRAHLLKLRRRDETPRTIAIAAKLPHATVGRIMRRDKSKAPRFVTAPVAAALLAVPVPKRKVERSRFVGNVPALAACRRLQAFARAGYGMSRLMAETGLGKTVIYEVRAGRCDWITPDTDATIRSAYDRLPFAAGEVINPDSRTIAWATKSGWAPASAWDDDTIADPNAVPRLAAEPPRRTDVEPANVHAAVAGGASYDELTHAELLEVVTTLLAWGWTHARIGAHLRWGEMPDKHLDNAAKFCNRNGLTVATARRGAPATAPTADTADDEQPGLELAA